MMIMRGPGGFLGGKVIESMVSHLDIYPTLCELAGVPTPAFVQGESLLPLVTGEAGAIHDAVFTEMTFHAAYEPQRAIRTDRWKYIRRFDGYDRPVLANCDDSATKDLLVSVGWGDGPGVAPGSPRYVLAIVIRVPVVLPLIVTAWLAEMKPSVGATRPSVIGGGGVTVPVAVGEALGSGRTMVNANGSDGRFVTGSVATTVKRFSRPPSFAPRTEPRCASIRSGKSSVSWRARSSLLPS